MKFTIICTDHRLEHNVDDVDIILDSKVKCKLQHVFKCIEDALNLDRKKFDYFIDYSNHVIKVSTTHAIFSSNLRDTKLSDLLNIEGIE
mgnify:CR=1 FL=1